ncbi:3-hydroxyacyl-CoA dehydrogenase family protein [Paracoccus versutus]|uniref:3-hydroxyacyl-CoA dehydrogenase family protein n=1 Tax=Paracoccus versutus TaxID=34007 RepID=UPI000DF82125|nr:3-hydroxyacyl-CoA dehydrogenase family protein [Paracoccus versutus]RDD68365.1 3-hydroxyacyl-CoA dehydrogenase family protein [Paracoccus versutus]
MRLSIIGAGTMGGGIAITSLKAGIPTTVVDTTESALDRLRNRIDRHLAREVEKGRMDTAGADAARACLTVSTDLGAVSGSDLLIEAVFEDLAVKHDLLSRVQGLLKPEAVIATNTSCLLVADIARALDDPGRLLGLHYFSPAEICPTVEVISTSETRVAIRQRALDFLARTGKSPLPCKDSPGFALNRFFCPYCNEAVRLLDENIATPGQIDAVACASFGVPAGPFRVMNLTKPVIMLRAMQGLERLGAFYRPAQGLLRAGGEGMDWLIDGDPPALPDAARAEVARRLTMALCRPAAEALAEGAVAPGDLDRGAREALRFQRTPITLLWALSPDDRRGLEATDAAS